MPRFHRRAHSGDAHPGEPRNAHDNFDGGGPQGGDSDGHGGRFFGRGHGHHHGSGHRFGGRHLKRLFAHGDLRLVILHLTADKPRHGYEIIKEIESMVGGAYSPSPGTIYPALTLLEEQGYVAIQPAEGAKKLYAITEAGRAHLQGNGGAVNDLLTRMNTARAGRKDMVPPAILQAMDHLKDAIGDRIAAVGMTDDEITRVVTILDEAAQAIIETSEAPSNKESKA